MLEILNLYFLFKMQYGFILLQNFLLRVFQSL